MGRSLEAPGVNQEWATIGPRARIRNLEKISYYLRPVKREFLKGLAHSPERLPNRGVNSGVHKNIWSNNT